MENNEEEAKKETKKIEEKYIEWEAPEHEHTEKSSDWLWVAIIITIAIFFASIILDNILFGLVVLLGGFSLTLYAIKKPQIIEIKIGPRGIQLQNNFFDYKNLESFWINYRGNESNTNGNGEELLIKSKKTFSPIITAMTGNADANEIENYLSNFLIMEEIEKPFSSMLLEILKI